MLSRTNMMKHKRIFCSIASISVLNYDKPFLCLTNNSPESDMAVNCRTTALITLLLNFSN